MKVLLEHNIPHSLRPLLSGEDELSTTEYPGWSDYEDDQLLEAAVVTLDRGPPHQQETQAYDLGIVVLTVHPTTPAHLKKRIDRARRALPRAASEQTVIVPE